MSHPAHLRRAACAVLLLMAGGCGTPSAPAGAGDDLVYREWWNFYERALHRMESGDYAGARADLETALGARAGARFGYDREQWRVRTYGMHFIEGYFPKRELGIALMHLGEDGLARQFLERSLRETPSGRAKHYLNMLFQKSAPHDAAAPDIATEGGQGPLVVRDRTRVLRGTATSAARVARVDIEGTPEFVELAEPAVGFARPVALHAGTNRVHVSARDLAGKETVREVVWIADWSPPSLGVISRKAEGGTVRVAAVCRDDLGLARVLQDGLVVGQFPAGTTTAHVDLSLPAGAACWIDVEDRAGNTNRLRLEGRTLTALATVPTLEFAEAGGSGVADAGSTGGYHPRDTLRPALSLSEPREIVHVFREEFFIDGQAEDRGGLAHVYVNGEPLLPTELAGTTEPFYWSRRLPLQPGTNQFEVAAEDRAGNVIVKQFAVVRDTPDHLRREMRLKAGVPPIESARFSDKAEEARTLLEAEINLELPGMKEPRFNLFARDKAMDLVLREQSLSTSALVDRSAALRLGKLMPVEILIIGGLQAHDVGHTILLSVVETDEGRILFSTDVYSPDLDQHLPAQVAGLARKLEQRFPMGTGTIARVRGGEVELALPAELGAGEGTRFVAYPSAGAGAPAEGAAARREGDRPVELRLSDANNGRHVATVLPSQGSQVLREGDCVFTR